MPRLPSDYGGQEAGPIDRSEYVPTLFDKRVDALRLLMGKVDPAMTSDVSRRTQEELDQETYDGAPYYGRWLLGLQKSLIERGHIGADELAERIGKLKSEQ
ncbi:MAG: hypothetical protein VW620_02080 [Rhodospirillales bacterium]|jgi:hypothetical protein